MNSNDLANFAQLAFASYFDLAGGTPSVAVLQDGGKGMATAEADAFGAKYSVVLPTYHDAASDLDVTVFKDVSGNLTLGIRGTLPGHDLSVTDAQIALQGAAYDQIVALYNWWKKISTPVGQQVSQFSLVEYPNADAVLPPSGAVKLYPTSLAFGGQSMYLVAAPSVVATGDLTGVLAADPDHKIDVTGHSLGAHLTLAFNALFGSSVGQAVGFDTPGFINGAVNQQFFAALGGSVPTSANSGNVTSVIADEASVGDKPFSAIAGVWSRPGVAVDIGIENQWLSDEPVPEGVLNHSMKMLADSLAVFNLLATLDLSLSSSRYKLLLNGAASGTAASYERLIDAAEALFGINQTPLAVGNNQRDALYQALYGVQASSAFQSMAGKVRIDASSNDLGAKARDDFSALASLITLSPFVLTATDAANQALLNAVLQGAWGSTYIDWQTDKTMSLADRQAGKETYSDKWLVDRSFLLDTLVSANRDNNNFFNDRALSDVWVYEDKTTGTLLARQPGGPGPFPQHYVTYGSSAAETLTGGTQEDHLYGGGGADILTGLGGNDWLEGNAGNDSLNGGAGNDSLLGGIGADNLDGGAGNDRLYGGDGADTYDFTGSFGNDIIRDSDGQGVIKLDGVDLQSGLQVNANTWRSADKSVTYTVLDAGGTQNLVIGFAGRNDTITIENWQAGTSLGVPLSDSPYEAPAPTGVLMGDLNPIITNGSYSLEYTTTGSANLVTDGTPKPGFADLLLGGAGNDLLDGKGGNNSLSGHDGDDHLIGGDGFELISGGSGSDWIEGGDGTDAIFGGASWEGFVLTDPNAQAPASADLDPVWYGRTWSMGYRQNADGSQTLWVDFLGGDFSSVDDGGDIIDAGAGNDVVDGDFGDDIIHGGLGLDLMWGGYGNDVVRGGDDADQLWGDGLVVPDLYQSLPEWAFGNDVIDGGAGDDTLVGQGGSDELYGGTGNDTLVADRRELDDGFHGHDYLDGGAGNDILLGEGGDDVLYGGEGNDQMQGDDQDVSYLDPSYNGEDYLDGEGGADIMVGGGFNDTLFGGDGDDQIYADDVGNSQLEPQWHGADYVDGEAGNDYITGDGNSDTLFGGLGNDTIWGDSAIRNLAASGGGSYNGADYIDGEEGNDVLVGGGNSDTLIGGDGIDKLFGDRPDGFQPTTMAGPMDYGNDVLDGGAGNDHLIGDGRSDTLFGGADDDFLWGDFLFPNDTSGAPGASDWLYGEAGNDTLQGGEAGDFLYGGDGNDTIYGGYELVADNAGNWIYGDAGADVLWGGGGDDLIEGGTEDDLLKGAAGDDVLDGGDGNDTLYGHAGNDSLQGSSGNDSLYGGDDDDTLDGGDGTDVAYGEAGNDTLVATSDLDVLVGGAGNDYYDIGTIAATVTEAAGEGIDTLASQAASVAAIANVENIVLNGYAAQSATGNALDNTLVGTIFDNTLSGGDGNDVLDGRDGFDSLIGGTGNDTFYVYSATESITEAGNGGIDTVRSYLTYTLASNLENLQLLDGATNATGNSLANVLTGNGASNTLTGLDGNDRLDGAGGADTLIGGAGDDTYVIDGQDAVVEQSGQGTDTIEVAFSHVLGANLENLVLTGSDPLNGTGNAVANVITGNAGANVLDGARAPTR
jgi:Ca2+-binding RTX toxin-like protein